ncbi:MULTISPECIES: EAL domain-containing protein [unclassified Lebetimonas]|uniref:EAL domain-containing protein n=1 Tax=unclassified Lebetimonas TaxID=2648158 RepID=UPI000467D791|nr:MULTISPECIES: EAL domain-containing protein [unclassified Lebetimonas]
MGSILSKMLKIIALSLFTATMILVILYFILLNFFIYEEVNKVRLCTKAIFSVKYSEMKDTYTPFSSIIKIYKKNTNIDFKLFSLFKNPELKNNGFFKKIKNKKEIYKINSNYITYYKPIVMKNECLKCHGYEKHKIFSCGGIKSSNKIRGFKKGDVVGYIEAKAPFKRSFMKFNLTFLISFFLLFLALIATLCGFYKFTNNLKRDITLFLKFFDEKVSKGIYEKLNITMSFIEFQKLKVSINKAVNSIKYYKNEMIKRYYFSPVTNLPNRIKLMEDMKKTDKNALAILNINKFREVNDYFSQEMGNLIIQEVAKRLKKLINNKIYHINIDEFAVLLDEYECFENCLYIKKIIKELEKPYIVNKNEINLFFRAGIGSKKEKDVFTVADIAVEYAKRKKVKCLCYCEIKDLAQSFEKNQKTLNILEKAMREDRIIPYFQPIVDNKTQKIVKYESLIRMIDENGKVYSPGEFLDVAKSVNIYKNLTLIVFEKTLNLFKERKEEVSLNLSLEDFEDDNIKEKIYKLIKNFPEPERITIELLENEDIASDSYILSYLQKLKNYGVKIFIDDFGSGYSNFSYLFKFQIDGLKIDGSLIKNILKDKKSQMIVQTMVEFAKKGNMVTVAEYVENREIFEFIKKLGVDYSQGYYFSAPKPLI